MMIYKSQNLPGDSSPEYLKTRGTFLFTKVFNIDIRIYLGSSFKNSKEWYIGSVNTALFTV